MTITRTNGPVGLHPRDAGTAPHRSAVDELLRTGLRRGGLGSVPMPVGLQLRTGVQAAPKAAKVATAKPKALIVIGNGHESVKQGVRHTGRKYFDEAALNSFAAHTKNHAVTIRHVNSAEAMRKAIEGGQWDTVIYFGHGVVNQQMLAPDERGRPITKEELIQALRKAGAKSVFLYGCKAGYTGLARALSGALRNVKVHGTFEVLEATWRQEDPDGRGPKPMINKFEFDAGPVEYTNGYQTKNGKKTKMRREELGDPVRMDDVLPADEPMVPQ